jgi:hypothetical protein
MLMDGLELDDKSVTDLYKWWAGKIQLDHAQWAQVFRSLRDSCAGQERLMTLLNRARGIGNTAATLIHQTQTDCC